MSEKDFLKTLLKFSILVMAIFILHTTLLGTEKIIILDRLAKQTINKFQALNLYFLLEMMCKSYLISMSFIFAFWVEIIHNKDILDKIKLIWEIPLFIILLIVVYILDRSLIHISFTFSVITIIFTIAIKCPDIEKTKVLEVKGE